MSLLELQRRCLTTQADAKLGKHYFTETGTDEVGIAITNVHEKIRIRVGPLDVRTHVAFTLFPAAHTQGRFLPLLHRCLLHLAGRSYA